MNIAILTDSSSSLYQTPNKHIYVLPLPIIFSNNTIINDDITNSDQQNMILTNINKQPLKTSNINPGILELTISELLEKYDHIIYLPIAYNLSNQYEISLTLLFDDNIKSKLTIVKHYFTGIQLGKFINYLQNNLNNNINEISNLIHMWAKNSFLAIIPSDLNILMRSGRVNKLLTKIAIAANLHVCINWNDNPCKITISKNYNKIIKKYITKVNNYFLGSNITDYQVYLAHTNLCNQKLVTTITNTLKVLNIKTVITVLPTIFAVHSGLDTIGLCAIDN